MNIYLSIILGAIIINYSINLIADILTIKKLTPNLPAEFTDTYDAKAYAKSQQYLKAGIHLDTYSATTKLIILLLFWHLGGFNYVDTQIRNLLTNNIARGILYFAILILAQSIINLPFKLYDTFIIEERFGFNKTTPRTYILDMLKVLLLSSLLGIPIFATILWFFTIAGTNAWLYSWLAITIFTLIIQFITPIWLLPLFNKFTPLEDGELKKAITNYTKKVNFPLTGIFVIDGSKRSAHSNAFFTGFGKNRRIALYDTLIEKHSTDQLVAIIAHEVGHWQKKHILKTIIISIIHSGIIFYLISLFINNKTLFAAFQMQHTSIYASILFFSMLYTPAELLLSIAIQAISRKHEYQADAFAIQTIPDPKSMITALKKLSISNLANLTPHPLQVFLNYSHPPILARIKAIKEKLPKNCKIEFEKSQKQCTLSKVENRD